MVNRETERKRLVELISQFERVCSDSCTGLEKSCTQCVLEQKADYILDNGIVVPPVEVGQILYVIEAGLIFEAKVKEYKYCSNSANGIHWHIIFEELFAISEAHIGKTVFTSREKAERALKGAEGK